MCSVTDAYMWVKDSNAIPPENATHVHIHFVICLQRVKLVEYLAQVAREASNNRFKFSYAHDVLLPEVSFLPPFTDSFR